MTRSPMPTHALNVPSKIKTTAVLEERFNELIPKVQTRNGLESRRTSRMHLHIGTILMASSLALSISS